ncbi:MAG: cation:proton antiporter, partial [Bdellovibrionales bacterium]|nr:cation:proton antiporter [Bdellovibrionales bacterium]
MHESFLKDVALVLGVAALISILSFKLRLPSVLGYLIAGLILGPYIPIPLFADPHRVESLSEFGVILVMFSIGLEFRLAKFFRVLPTSGITASLEIGAMFLVGLSIGYLFEWSIAQSIFMGGALSISSTMIVSKIFEETPPDAATKDHVLGVLVIQDVVAILLLTVLGAFAASSQLNFDNLLPTISKLIFTLIFLTVVGLFIIPKFIRQISSQKNSEVLIIGAVGFCFVLALIVKNLGYSVALGAFLAGILVSESGEGHKVELLSKPLKDVFVAIFFVSVGMTVDPMVALKVLPQSLFITLLVILSQFFIVFIGSVLSGAGMNRALFSSLSLGQIGEFSFIIAAIGAGAGMVTQDFQAIVVTVAIFTSLSTPLLWKNSSSIIERVSKQIPQSLRIAIGLYEAWFHRIKELSVHEGRFLGIPKKVLIGLCFDSFLLVTIPPLFLKFLPGILEQFGLDRNSLTGQLIAFILLAIILTPIIYGFTKMASSLIIRLSQTVFSVSLNPAQEASPAEKLFKLTVWSILCLIVSFPFLASLSPFIDTYLFVVLVTFIFATILFRLWKSAGKVAFEYEAGSERLVSVIKRQTYHATPFHQKEDQNLFPKIPGLDDVDSITISNQNLVGKTLAELNIRNLTGATVVSITRKDQLIMFPIHSQTILLGDIFQIWGHQE